MGNLFRYIQPLSTTLKQCLLLSILWSLVGFHLMAQPRAFASFKPDRVETGDTFLLFVIVSDIKTAPKSVDFASWATLFPAANILNRSDWHKTGTQWSQQFTLIAFDSARLNLPPLTILQNVGAPLATNPLSLTVFPTPGEEVSEMEPIRDIYREPVLLMDYWPWALGSLVGLLILFWVIRRATRRPAPVIAPIFVEPPSTSASETALKKLSTLQNLQLWKKGEGKEHHAKLSLIVREYLEVQYHIAALESTTPEILAMVTSTSLPATEVPLLKEILYQTDMVKYAQSEPPDSAQVAVLEKARTFVAPNSKASPETPSVEKGKTPGTKPDTRKYKPL